MRKELLRSIMVLYGDTSKDLADYLGISEQSASNKINENGTEFKLREIRLIKRRYALTADQVDLIFFAE